MALVAEHNAVFTDPFYVALLAVEEVRHLTLLPTISEAVNIDFNRNSFDFNLFATEKSNLLLKTSTFSVDDQGTRNGSFDLGIHFRADVLKEGKNGGERSNGCNFDG
jgi:hypothetical protein